MADDAENEGHAAEGGEDAPAEEHGRNEESAGKTAQMSSMAKPPALDQLPGEHEGNEDQPAQLTRWQQWLEWAEKNARPKVRFFVKMPLPKGRWAKSPMTEADWDRWDQWAEKNALPREELDEPEPPKRKRVPLENLIVRIESLSKPKHVREKFVFKKEVFYFMPALKPGQPPLKERPRKVKQPKMRKCFPTIEVEADFFRFILVFPISPTALLYIASEKIKMLAQPRKYPQDPHCPVPPEFEMPPRIKMTAIQWAWHLRRLVYLAAPKKRLDPPVEKPLPRGRKKPLRQLQPRFKRLARPREHPTNHYREIGIQKSALKANASARTKKLAQPRHKRKKYKASRAGTGVNKNALKYNASSRIQELSKHKEYPEPREPKKKKKMWSKIDDKCKL